MVAKPVTFPRSEIFLFVRKVYIFIRIVDVRLPNSGFCFCFSSRFFFCFSVFCHLQSTEHLHKFRQTKTRIRLISPIPVLSDEMILPNVVFVILLLRLLHPLFMSSNFRRLCKILRTPTAWVQRMFAPARASVLLVSFNIIKEPCSRKF